MNILIEQSVYSLFFYEKELVISIFLIYLTKSKNRIKGGKEKIVLKYILFCNCRSSAAIIALLEDKRKNLPITDASIEKCLILNRLITYIREVTDHNFLINQNCLFYKHQEHFMDLLSKIQLDMKTKMTSNQSAPTIKYPKVNFICYFYSQ